MKLSTFFKNNPKVALAFSGGVDSSYLLYTAKKHGAEVSAYFVKSQFQPQFELEDAKRIAEYIDADLKIITADVLMYPEVSANPLDRCYHCKKIILSAIAHQAQLDGYKTIIDGTNASDKADNRPGMRALKEFSVISPLQECGLVKDEIRRLSKEAGLFTWDKPAYACLATRIPTNEAITKSKLEKIELAEDYLFSLGFCDFRVRMLGSSARIEVTASDMYVLIKYRSDVVKEMKKHFDSVMLDLEARDE